VLLRFGLVLAIGAVWFVALVAYSRWLVAEGGTNELFLPSSLADAKRLHAALAQLLAEDSDRGAHALCLFALTYLWKQSFAVPGSAVLNVLAGSLFGMWRALLLTSALTATGATVCFSLSKAVGSDAIAGAFPRAWARVEALRTEVDGERARGGGALFAWLIAARLFPFTPNWLLNMSFPHLGVQPAPFFLSVLLGLSVYNYITCSAGAVLFSLTSMSDITDTRSVLAMLGLFVVVVGFAMWSGQAKQARAQKKNI
jgi:uncharacterized membrane protein YdjX (TVP38/TMEM64 family)